MLGALINDWTMRLPGLGYRDRLMMDEVRFHQQIARERLRACRRAIPFCVLTLTLKGTTQRRRRTGLLARLIHRHLRLTDQKGFLGLGKFGVLLVDTGEMGGRCATDRLTDLMNRHNLQVDVALHVHDPEGFGSEEFGSEGFGSEASPSVADGRRRVPIDGGGPRASGPSASGPSDRGFSDGEPNGGDVELLHDASTDQPAPGLETVDDVVAGPLKNGVGTAVLGRSRPEPMPIARGVGSYAYEHEMLPPRRPRGRVIAKRGFDIVAASCGLICVSPAIGLAMLLIRRQDGGPALFKQTREGHNGKPFTIYKLRTMVIDAEKHQSELRSQSHRDGPAFKIHRDPRITAIGHFLRRSCMDELPQLWNVLKGDMSLVGPRPLPWHESRQCQRWHRRRLELRPGLTCYWQINKASIESFDDWMRLDLRYVDRGNLWEDVRLIVQTIKVPILGRGSE